jgi:hypothetical protein
VAALLHRLGPERTTLPDTGSLRGDLMAGLALFCRVAERKRALLLGLMPAVRADAELARLLRDHIAEPGAAKATALFERARARGEIGSVPDPGPLLEVAEALVWRRLLVTGDPLDDGFVAHAVDRMLLPIVHGDAARPPA